MNAIFDISNVFHTIAGYESYKDNTFLAKKGDKDRLIGMVINSMLYKLDYMKLGFDRVYVCFDSGMSWRKKVYPEYKAKRNKDRYKFDYISFLDSTNDFADFIGSNTTMIPLKLGGYEADDIISYVANREFLDNRSSVIVSSDMDYAQLLKTYDNRFIIAYNPDRNHNTFYLPVTLPMMRFDDMSFFDDNFDGSDIMPKGKEIDPNKILLMKCLCGDKSDNIPSSYIRESKNKKVDISFTRERFDKMSSSGFFDNFDITFASVRDESEVKEILKAIIMKCQKSDIDNVDHYLEKYMVNLGLIDLSIMWSNEDIRNQFELADIKTFDYNHTKNSIKDSKYSRYVEQETKTFKFFD
jgi:5'-3' exonuclease